MASDRGLMFARVRGRCDQDSCGTSAVSIPSQLLKSEMAACFPTYKDISSFEFGASKMNEVLIRQWHRCEFMDRAKNVVWVGG